MIYNKAVVIPVLIIFVALITFPFWKGGLPHKPAPKIAVQTDVKCVESAEWMRANHMKLLDEWRHSVVREQNREYTSTATGKVFNKSLVNTCLDCHSNKSEFCDSCHTYASVKLNCFGCHVNPEMLKE
ncbi:MAG: sulfate reduction electron transfer complex DsrMKJOP subunit DsrJ [SAR324 cluster bacterium]|nr:sulfate reduction electron transfer complex DsrMKJOP subunit DsrJ [SAR324 cluster bacterium]